MKFSIILATAATVGVSFVQASRSSGSGFASSDVCSKAQTTLAAAKAACNAPDISVKLTNRQLTCLCDPVVGDDYSNIQDSCDPTTVAGYQPEIDYYNQICDAFTSTDVTSTTDQVTTTSQPRTTATVSTGGSGGSGSGTGTTSGPTGQCATDFKKFYSDIQPCFPEDFNPDGSIKDNTNLSFNQLTASQITCLCSKSNDIVMDVQTISTDCPASQKVGLDADGFKQNFANICKKSNAIKSIMNPVALFVASAGLAVGLAL
ncbi:hypothetical protein HDU76_013264 [Blyttiomyces sp. JEL0837]|nr:hypothetical protein HDU76_013264 [Blyttiomyces sp. JEL0837]